MVKEHSRHDRVRGDCRSVLRGLRRLFHLDAEKLAKLPRPLRGFPAFYLMKDVACRRLPDLDDIIIVPVAVNAHMLGIIRQKIESGPSGAFVLVLVLPARLRARSFSRLNMAKPQTVRHDVA